MTMNITKREARELLDQLLGDELSGRALEEAEASLAAHPALMGELRAHRALQRSLSAMRGAEPSAGFEQRLQKRLTEADEPGWGARVVEAIKGLLMPLTVAAAAAGVVALLLWKPPSSGTDSSVAASSMLGSDARVEVSLRLRAGSAHWESIRAAAQRAGVSTHATPIHRGEVWVDEIETNAEGAGRAMQEIARRMPVEVSGPLPPAGTPVLLKIVLTQP